MGNAEEVILYDGILERMLEGKNKIDEAVADLRQMRLERMPNDRIKGKLLSAALEMSRCLRGEWVDDAIERTRQVRRTLQMIEQE